MPSPIPNPQSPIRTLHISGIRSPSGTVGSSPLAGTSYSSIAFNHAYDGTSTTHKEQDLGYVR